MGRVDLDIGPPPADPSIGKRLEAYKKGAEDPHLEALMFQYGRYLLISSSRDLLPANLQGLWNNQNKPAWYADYHTNINIQMNYWLAEPANLSECALPLFNWTTAMIPGSRAATLKAFGEKTPGWTMRTSVNIYGGNGWQWNLPSSAWLAQHFWEHYAFTGDQNFWRKPPGPSSAMSAPIGSTTSSKKTASSSSPKDGRPSTARARMASPMTSRSSGTSSPIRSKPPRSSASPTRWSRRSPPPVRSC